MHSSARHGNPGLALPPMRDGTRGARRVSMQRIGWFLLILLLGACAPEEAPTPIASAEAPLLGGVDFGSGAYREPSGGSGDPVPNARACTAAEQATLRRAADYAQVLLASEAYEECIRGAFAGRLQLERVPRTIGPYLPCNGSDADGRFDPTASTPVGAASLALDVLRDSNAGLFSCADNLGPSVIAQAPYLDANFFEVAEAITFLGRTIAGVARAETLPVCTATLTTNCHEPGNGLPHLAGSMLHEMMHSHRYGHDSCGYPASVYDGFTNSAPYIAETCALEVGAMSELRCAATRCPTGRVALVTGYGDASCECVSRATDMQVRSARAFLHRVTTASLVTASATVIANADLGPFGGDPSAVIQITHVWNPDGDGWGPYVPAATRVRFDASGSWRIETVDGSPIPVGASFAVRVGRGLRVRTTAGGVISHPLLSTSQGPITATPMTGATQPFSLALDRGQWLAWAPATGTVIGDVELAITVSVPENRGLHYLHTSGSDLDASPSPNTTLLDHPLLNQHPNALVLVTPIRSYAGQPIVPSAVGVWYDTSLQRWGIYREDRVRMPSGTSFYVEVLADERQRFVEVPEVVGRVDTGIIVLPGDRLVVHGYQSIVPSWKASTGVGIVGPEGTGTPAPGGWLSGFPYPGLSSYGLVASIGTTSFGVGPDVARNATAFGSVSLDINDAVRGDGSGFFTARVRVLAQPVRWVR